MWFRAVGFGEVCDTTTAAKADVAKVLLDRDGQCGRGLGSGHSWRRYLTAA